MSLWTAAEAEAATGGQARGNWSATGVSIDTRTLRKGDLFVALRAARDGHEFVATALEHGAAAALVSHVPDGLADDAPLLVVDDVQTALEALGRAGRDRTRARIVAITGSVGKTSTKEMLAQVLGAQGRTHASVASYNNHWGVPLTLARMPRDTQYAVIEIGMNHPGEISPLARMTRPHVVMVTTVAPAHLEAFTDIDDIAREKASIADGLEPNGFAVLNGDVATFPILQAAAQAAGARVISFGALPHCHHRAKDIAIHDTVTTVQARAWRTPVLFKIAAPGRHLAMNALGALAAIWVLGADRGLAAAALGGWTAFRGRGAREVVQIDPADADLTLELIDDAYNANPASVEAALEVLAAAHVRNDIGRVARGRRIAVLGDMKELGRDEASLHGALADLPEMDAIDRVHCVGPLMRGLHARLSEEQRGLWAPTSDKMARALRGRFDSGDVVLVKGSLSMGLIRVVDAIRKMGHPAPQNDD